MINLLKLIDDKIYYKQSIIKFSGEAWRHEDVIDVLQALRTAVYDLQIIAGAHPELACVDQIGCEFAATNALASIAKTLGVEK